MAEYRWPRKLKIFILISFLSGAMIVSALIIEDSVRTALSIGPGFSTLGGDLVYFKDDGVSTWRLHHGLLTLRFILFTWAVYGACWLFCRRLYNTVYGLNSGVLTRLRGRTTRRLALSEVIDAKVHPIRGLVLKSGASTLAVSLNVEGARELVSQLKRDAAEAGGAFLEESYRKSLVSAARNSFWNENLGSMAAGFLFSAVVMIVASSVACGAFGATRDVCVMTAAGSCLASCIYFVFYTWFSWGRFRDASRDEWVAPTGAFAWRVAVASAAATLVLWAVCGAIAAYAVDW